MYRVTSRQSRELFGLRRGTFWGGLGDARDEVLVYDVGKSILDRIG